MFKWVSINQTTPFCNTKEPQSRKNCSNIPFLGQNSNIIFLNVRNCWEKIKQVNGHTWLSDGGRGSTFNFPHHHQMAPSQSLQDQMMHCTSRVGAPSRLVSPQGYYFLEPKCIFTNFPLFISALVS